MNDLWWECLSRYWILNINYEALSLVRLVHFVFKTLEHNKRSSSLPAVKLNRNQNKNIRQSRNEIELFTASFYRNGCMFEWRFNSLRFCVHLICLNSIIMTAIKLRFCFCNSWNEIMFYLRLFQTNLC